MIRFSLNSDAVMVVLPRSHRRFARQKKWPPACAGGLPWSDYPSGVCNRGRGSVSPLQWLSYGTLVLMSSRFDNGFLVNNFPKLPVFHGPCPDIADGAGRQFRGGRLGQRCQSLQKILFDGV